MSEKGAFGAFLEAYGKDTRKARKIAAILTLLWLVLLIPVALGFHGIALQVLMGYSVIAFLPWIWFGIKAI